VKLAAICMLWMPQTEPESLLLQPMVIRPAMAAAQAATAAQAETPKAEAGNGSKENAAAPEANATAAGPATEEERMQALNAREQALDRREAELRTLERELDEKLENLKALEVRMQKLIDSAGTIQDEKMAHLVDVYSNMKPKQAAQVLGTLDETIAVRILAGMSGRKAGEILSSVQADRAAALSEALTRLQTGNN
jgi:flagellar motility protein MotE (MotC chaperone)